MKDCVIYTAIVGGYDFLPQPKIVSDNCDYICFTNDSNKSKIGVWEIRKIPFICRDNIRLSRFVKLNPHRVFKNYKYSLWIDSNIQILDDYIYNQIEIAKKSGVLWGAIKHPDKNCIYVDARSCACGGNEGFFAIYNQCKFLRSEGYPDGNGLFENNIIFRDHNSKIIVKIDEQWWSIYLKYSKRDQLCLCYVFWKFSFVPTLLFPENVNTWNKEHFNRVTHIYSFRYRIKRRLRHYINLILFKVFKF